jgi:hypothetical protein
MWCWYVLACFSQFGLSWQNIALFLFIHNRNLFLTVLKVAVWSQGAQEDWLLAGGSLHGLQKHNIFLFPHMGKELVSFLASSYKGTNLINEGFTFMTYLSSNSPPPNNITLVQGFSMWIQSVMWCMAEVSSLSQLARSMFKIWTPGIQSQKSKFS